MHAGTPRRIVAGSHKPLASVDYIVFGDNIALALILKPCGLNLGIWRSWHIVQDVVMELVMDVYIKLVNKSLA